MACGQNDHTYNKHLNQKKNAKTHDSDHQPQSLNQLIYTLFEFFSLITFQLQHECTGSTVYSEVGLKISSWDDTITESGPAVEILGAVWYKM